MKPVIGMVATISSGLDLVPAVVTAVGVSDGVIVSVTLRQEEDGGFYDKGSEHTYQLNEDGGYGDAFDRVFEFGHQHTFNAFESLEGDA